MRILVTDDDPSILGLVATILRRADFDVDTARNGDEAMRFNSPCGATWAECGGVRRLGINRPPVAH